MFATYDPWIVGLSVVIAVFASYTALDLASRVTAAERSAAILWMLGGAFSMGIGIWSMHFIGMLAYQLSIPLAYDVPITLLSMVPAIGISALALFIIRQRSKSVWSLVLSGVLMGAGIVAMHYTGMAAMRMQPAIQYDPLLFTLSVLIAIGAATAALWIAGLFHSAQPGAKVVYQKLGSAIVMGLAISGMHYTGMAAANVAPGSICLVTPFGVAPQWLAVLVGAGTFVILSVTLLVSVFDARLASQAQKMLADLRAVQTFLSSIVENMPNMVFVKDAAALRFVHFNRAGERLTGYRRDQLIGKNDHDLFPKEQADLFVAKDREVLAGGHDMVVGEETITRTDGTSRLLQTVKLPIPDENGSPKYLLGISEDITERKRAEEQLRIAARAFEHTADGVIIYDAQKRIVSVNKAFTTITGYPEGDVVGKHADFLRSGKHDDAFYRDLDSVVDERGHWQGEMSRRRKSGEVYPALCSISAVKDERGVTRHYVTVFNDISSFKEYEAKLEYLAHHDALTGLPNRALFQERFKQALVRARRHKDTVAVLFIDLDQFKTINDSLGHQAGDELLQVVATRLQECVRASDVVARLGGDEFTVLLEELKQSQDAARVAEKILEALAKPYAAGGHDLSTSGSIGISCYPGDGADVETLLKNADTAMYQAKEKGRNNYQFFSAELNDRAYGALVMKNSLRLALQRDEFVLHYQPRYNLLSGAIVGMEALIRWRHPDGHEVPPGKFIPLAEDTGLIVPIGEWVLRTACLQLREWRKGAMGTLRMAVNLSPRQFRQADLPARIAAVLRETGVPAEALELEITEGVVMHDPEASGKMLRDLKASGIAIAIDDFGTGYSSLNYLKRFPIDFLKIDRAFVRDLHKNPADVAIVQAIIALAKGLRMTAIAEGVELEEQGNLLRLLGCEQAQGFLYSKPRPASEIGELLLKGRQAA